jgi:hypothetical protein
MEGCFPLSDRRQGPGQQTFRNMLGRIVQAADRKGDTDRLAAGYEKGNREEVGSEMVNQVEHAQSVGKRLFWIEEVAPLSLQ